MMAISNLEQALGVNPFGKSIDVDRKPEMICGGKMIVDNKLENVYDYYKTIQNEEFSLYDRNHFFSNNIHDILNPAQIQILFQRIVHVYPVEKKGHVEELINYLIQTCYNDANKNDFVLDSGTLNLLGLCHELNGKSESRLTVKINGRVGVLFGVKSKNVDFMIDGDTDGYCGKLSKNCSYIINGNAKESCGMKTEKCAFTIKGAIGTSLAEESKQSQYIISDFNPTMFEYYFLNCEPQECIFATEKIEVYKSMLAYIPDERKNKARLIGKNNIVLEEVQV